MRIAIAGKGGAGKTTICASLARLYAARGLDVYAIDADSNPNLASALGIDPDRAAGVQSLPVSAVSRRLDGPALTLGLDELLEGYAIGGADGIRLMLMGMPQHAEEGCMCSAHATVGAVLADLQHRPQAITLIDMEASPEHFSRGTVRHADTVLLITEPYWRSLETTRRMAELAAELPIDQVAVVANKVRNPDDLAAITEFCGSHGLTLLGAVPRSDVVLDADMAARSLIDTAAEGAPVVSALRDLGHRLYPTVMQPI